MHWSVFVAPPCVQMLGASPFSKPAQRNERMVVLSISPRNCTPPAMIVGWMPMSPRRPLLTCGTGGGAVADATSRGKESSAWSDGDDNAEHEETGRASPAWTFCQLS